MTQRNSFANLYSIGEFLTTGTSNQIFYYIRHINLKHVASRQSCNCEKQGNTVPSEKMLQQCQVVGSNVFNLAGPKLEPQTSYFRTNTLLLDQLTSVNLVKSHSK